jgi:thioredoxin 1
MKIKNSTIIIFIVVILGLTIAVSYFFSQKDSTKNDQITNSEKIVVVEEDVEEGEHNMTGHVRYGEYSKEVLDNASEMRRVLFFYASWCPTCRPADADFRANLNKLPEDVSIIRVNYNDPETDEEEKALAKKYGVTYQHTYVQIDAEGNPVAKWNGGQTEELLKNIK